MATISVTTVNTVNGTTDFTLSTGNTSAADIVIYANGYGMVLGGNSTSNTLVLVSNGNIGINNTTPTVSLTISANAGAASATFNGGNTFIRLASNGSFSEPAIEFAEAGFSPTAKIASKNEASGGGSLYFITRDTSSTSSTLTNRMRITGTGNVVISGNTLTLGTSTIAANGYTYLPNGLKINFGNFAANTTVGNASFSSAFTTIFTVYLSSGNNLANSIYLSSSNTTMVQGRTSSVANPGGLLYYWAIGV